MCCCSFLIFSIIDLKVFLIDEKFNQLSDKILIGPQAEILEQLGKFNNQMQTDLSITKTFRWSPGVYLKVRELLMKSFLGWDKRSNIMYSLFNKIANNDWKKRRIGEELNRLDSTLYNYRQDGMVFQDNPAEVKEYMTLFFFQLNNLVM